MLGRTVHHISPSRMEPPDPVPIDAAQLQQRLQSIGDQALAAQKRIAATKQALADKTITREQAQQAIQEANRVVLDSLRQLESLHRSLRPTSK